MSDAAIRAAERRAAATGEAADILRLRRAQARAGDTRHREGCTLPGWHRGACGRREDQWDGDCREGWTPDDPDGCGASVDCECPHVRPWRVVCPRCRVVHYVDPTSSLEAAACDLRGLLRGNSGLLLIECPECDGLPMPPMAW